MFYDRKDAALQLVEYLKPLEHHEGVVLGIPRGGMVTAHYLAKALEWPLSYVLTKKIGHPANKEFAIGAIGLHEVFLMKGYKLSRKEIAESIHQTRELIESRLEEYSKVLPPVELKGKVVVITDDGVATGNTIKLAIKEVKIQQPNKVVVAIPVGPPETINELKTMADEVICLYSPEYFRAVGHFYKRFDQVSDDEVLDCLKLHAAKIS